MSQQLNPDVVAQYERDRWDRCADGYLDTFASLTRETVPLLAQAGRLCPGSRVLEIGSGPGHVADALAKGRVTVTGVDFSSQMLDVARRRYPDLTFQEANAEALPFDTGTFDAVVSNFTVHHLARPEMVFREVCRVLTPGGRFAFVVWGAPEAQSSIGVFVAAAQAHHTFDGLPRAPLFGVIEQGVYQLMLEGAGLEACRLSAHDVIWRSRTLEPILRGFWDWGNMAALPQEVQERIEAMTRENARAYAEDDAFAFPHTVVLGSAVKPS